MSLSEFARPETERGTRVTVLNPEHESPVYRLLTDLFGGDAVTVRETETDSDETPSDAVIVQKEQAGLAVSPLSSVRDELLLVNSDVYVTGARDLDEVKTPDVIRSLDGVPFTVTGYPDNPKEKLLLIEISRHIEATAWRAGEGRLDAGFQFLSRLEDERGTRRVYDRLAGETRVDTHVYGVPDARPSVGATTHGVENRELRRTWFVVYGSTVHPREAAALVAVETEPHRWEGCWTYETGEAAAILDYLDCTYG